MSQQDVEVTDAEEVLDDAEDGQDVEDALRLSGQAEFDANDVGLAILAPLRALDEVAYLRFASVYRAFENAEDFEKEIEILRLERNAQAGFEPGLRPPSTSETAPTG